MPLPQPPLLWPLHPLPLAEPLWHLLLP